MTSKSDPTGRNLGPVLAIAGLVVVAGALIAGFVVTGGPGDARAYRLDDLVMSKMDAIAGAAQCGYAKNGAMPATIAELKAAAESGPDAKDHCLYIEKSYLDDLSGIDYAAKEKNRIEMCAVFERPTRTDENRGAYRSWDARFRELQETRPQAGRHCFDVKLFEPGSAPN